MHRNEWDLLRGVSPEDSREMLALGTPLTLGPGEVVFDLAEEATCIYLVARGKVELSLPIRLGGKQEHVAVEERVPGQMLGWSALVPPHRFTLRATTSIETELLSLPREDLRRVLSSRPDAGHVLMTNLATIVGQRFQVFQAMWLREIQRALEAGDA
jgi:CRP-like cAMP-binding protein